MLTRVLAIALAAALPVSARALETVSVGIVGAASDITLFLAEKKGYMRDEGLTANLLVFDSGAKMVAPLGAGQLDVGGGAWSAGLFNAVGRGIGIKIVADKATNRAPYSYRVMLLRRGLEGKVKSFADFKGLKVGITANGAGDNSGLDVAMRSAGLTLKDVERVYMGFSTQLVALGNGGIDAALSAEPDATIAVRQGMAVKFAPLSSWYPVQESSVILFGGPFIAQHRATAQKFITAYLRGVRDYDDALEDGHIAGPGAGAVQAALGELTKTQDLSVFREMVASWANPDGKIDMASLRRDLAFFESDGDVENKLDVDDLVDPSFVAAALEKLGPYQPRAP